MTAVLQQLQIHLLHAISLPNTMVCSVSCCLHDEAIAICGTSRLAAVQTPTQSSNMARGEVGLPCNLSSSLPNISERLERFCVLYLASTKAKGKIPDIIVKFGTCIPQGLRGPRFSWAVLSQQLSSFS